MLRLFPADAVVNVHDYGASGNDMIDDTAAIQKAISDHVGTGRTLYFPAGIYYISDTLVWKNKAGRWDAHLTLQGEDREKSAIYLTNRTPAFGDPAKPKPMIMTGSHWQPGDADDGGGNKAFRNNIHDLTIDPGDFNPGAIGIEWAVSNQGTIHRCRIGTLLMMPDRPFEGAAVAGISMKRRIPGPGLISRTTIHRFDVGIDYGDIQYGITLTDSGMSEQKIASVRVTDNLVHAWSIGTHGTGFQGLGAKSVITVADSEMVNFAQGPFHTKGHLYHHKIWADIPMAEHEVMLKTRGLLPAERVTEYWNQDLTQWQPVGARLDGEKDDTAAIQRAIDAGKPVVYFPIKRDYFLSDTITIRGKVRHVLGMGVEISLGAAKEPFSDKQKPRPLFRIDPVEGDDLTIENCFFNAQYPGEVIFENNSPKTLTIKHCMGWVGADGHRRSYQNTPASFGGKVFIEDCFLPGWRFEKQDVWARQFNPENHESDGKTPQVANIGGKLWILGFKTEGPAPFIHTSAGGTTELLGAYNYISATAAPKVPTESVPYIVEDSTASLTFATDNFRPDSDYRVYIREIKDGKVVKEVPREEMPPRNGVKGDRSFVVTQYRTK